MELVVELVVWKIKIENLSGFQFQLLAESLPCPWIHRSISRRRPELEHRTHVKSLDFNGLQNGNPDENGDHIHICEAFEYGTKEGKKEWPEIGIT